MSQDYIRLFYLEILLLTVIALLFGLIQTEIYYALSAIIMVFTEIFYLKGRGKLAPTDKLKFWTILLILTFILACWLLGRESNNSLFNFDVGAEGAWGIYIIPIIVPSFQFILSVMMLEERN